MSVPIDVLAVIDAEIRILQAKLGKYRQRAERACKRLGERSCAADRLVDWAAMRLDALTKARAAIAALLIEKECAGHSTQPPADGEILRGNSDLVPSEQAEGWAPR